MSNDEGIIPDTGKLETDMALEIVASYQITSLLEHMTIDWAAELLDDQIAKMTLKRGGQQSTKQAVKSADDVGVSMSKKMFKKFGNSLRYGFKSIQKRLMGHSLTKQGYNAFSTVAQSITKSLGYSTKAGVAAAKGGSAGAKGGVAGAKGSAAASKASMGPVGIAIMAVTLAFDIMNLILDFADVKGYGVIYDPDMIDEMVITMDELINETFKEETGIENFSNEEIDFEPLFLLIQFDEEGSMTFNENWVNIYNDNIHYYMTEIKGHPNNWKETLTEIELGHESLELKKVDTNEKEKKNKSNKILIISAILILFVIILLLLINVK